MLAAANALDVMNVQPVGRGQAVRRGTLAPVFGGSILPPQPVQSHLRPRV